MYISATFGKVCVRNMSEAATHGVRYPRYDYGLARGTR